MDRIAETFATACREKRSCFIAYLCAGDPNYTTSLALCRALIDGGIDILELGVPFSDPLADGKTNQRAAQRALESGMTQEKVFQLVRDIRQFSEIPIVFYTYYNLVLAPGVDVYAQKCQEAGVDGLLTLDCPPEEAGELLSACKNHSLKTVFIVAPSTPGHRIPLITQAASGFVYYVSRAGVTGERKDLVEGLDKRVAAIRAHTDLPVAVGFGISHPEHVREIGSIADGVVVGSALVNTITDGPMEQAAVVERLKAKLAFLLGVKNLGT